MTVHEIISKHGHEFRGYPWFYAVDTNQMQMDRFNKSKFKILMCFLSDGEVRSVSNTFTFLHNVIYEECPDIFIDQCYMPMREDLKLYEKYSLPFWFGNITHQPVEAYDMIMISVSIVGERITQFYAMDQCGIKIDHNERMADPKQPFVFLGGVCAPIYEIGLGPFQLDGKVGVSPGADLVYLGEAPHRMSEMLNKMVEMKEAGKSKMEWIEELVPQYDNLYYPAGYDVRYREDNPWEIESITTNKSWVPEEVVIYNPPDMEGPQMERTLHNYAGVNSGSAELQISRGCSGYGVCNFAVAKGTPLYTKQGIRPIEECLGEVETQGISWEKMKGIQQQTDAVGHRISYKSGFELITDAQHKNMVFSEGELVERLTQDLKPGDIVLRKLGADVYSETDHITVDEALLLGFHYGDGNCRLNSAGNVALQMYFTPQEFEIFKPILAKLFGGKCNPRPFYKGKTGFELWAYYKTVSPDSIFNIIGKEHKIPQEVFKSSPKVIGAFLSGLFQADGWNTENIGLTTIHKTLAQDVQLFLAYLGIDSTLRKNEFNSSNRGKFKDGYDRKDSYYIHVKSYYLPLFMEKIGFLTEEKSGLHDGWEVSSGTVSDVPHSILLRDVTRSHFSTREEIENHSHKVLYRAPQGNYSRVSRYALMSFHKKYPEIELPQFYQLIAEGRFIPDEVLSVEDTGKVYPMYDVVNTESHLCVYGGILTHQCLEGNTHGQWTEIPIGNMDRLLKTAKKFSGGNKIRYYSFNSNFMSYYNEMLRMCSDYFDFLSLINLRVDEIGANPKIVDIAKAQGLVRMGMAVEGLGERIRNVFMNKNLSFETLKEAATNVFRNKLTDLKMGMIISYYETEEDIDEGIAEFEELVRIRDSLGSRTGMQLKFTPLVAYEHTPLRFIERRAAKASLNNTRSLQRFITRMRELGIRTGFNGRGLGTFMEQILLDAGRKGTHHLVNLSIKNEMIWYGSFGSPNFKDLVETYKSYDLDTLLNERPKDWIYPSNMIKLKSQKGLEQQTQNLLEGKPTQYCLKTHSNPETYCRACGNCDTKEQIDSVTKREFVGEDLDLFDVVQARADNKAVKTVRIQVQKHPAFKMIEEEALRYIIVSQLSQVSPEFLDSVHSSEGGCANFYPEGYELRMSGTYFFDINFKTHLSNDIIVEAIHAVNEKLTIARINPTIHELIEYSSQKLRPTDRAIYTFSIDSSNLSSASITDRIQMWDGKYSRRILGETDAREYTDFMEKPYVRVVGSKLVGTMDMELRHNPIYVLSRILNQGYHRMLISTDISRNMVYYDGAQICECQKHPTMIYRFREQIVPLCSSCYQKRLLTQASH